MIVTVTPNAALDKTVVVPRFSVGKTNRGTIHRVDVGGKGINVARALRELGSPVLATGFLSDDDGGREIAAWLGRHGIETDFVAVPGGTRVNLKVLDPATGLETEINEPGCEIPLDALARLTERLKKLARRATLMVFAGSLPPGLPPDTYARLIRLARDEGVMTVLDTAGTALQQGILAGPDLVKPNRAEVEDLLGVELMFLDYRTQPSEAEQRRAYEQILDLCGASRVIVRALDLGGDKSAWWLGRPPEINPSLGLRGIRLLLAHQDLLVAQLRALIAAGRGAGVRLLLPMVTDATEIMRVRDLARTTTRPVNAGGAASMIRIGAMIETPAAALAVNRLAEHADFLSIGTNDLSQYVLAADRQNPTVASPLDAFHPAVIRLIREAAAAAARQGRPIGLCGEMASDPSAIPLLVGLGIRELSVRPDAVARVKGIVRRIAARAAEGIAIEVGELDSASAVVDRLRRFVETEVAEDARAAGQAR